MNIWKFRTIIYLFWEKFKSRFFYGFAHLGSKSVVYSPMKINYPKSIYIGDNSTVSDYAWLMGSGKGISLRIGCNTTIGHFSHIIALHSLSIEDNVLIADRVFITDCTHKYKDISSPVIEQGVKVLRAVRIGEGSWLGENVCVIGASIGKHCIIGANSVIKEDIPDYCVVEGNPAKVIKKYDYYSNKWIVI